MQPCTFAVNKDDIKHDTVILVFEVPKPDPDIELDKGSIIFNVVLDHTPLDGDMSFDAGRIAYHACITAIFNEVALILDTFAALV
jgi:hypothetical protein